MKLDVRLGVSLKLLKKKNIYPPIQTKPPLGLILNFPWAWTKFNKKKKKQCGCLAGGLCYPGLYQANKPFECLCVQSLKWALSRIVWVSQVKPEIKAQKCTGFFLSILIEGFKGMANHIMTKLLLKYSAKMGNYQ